MTIEEPLWLSVTSNPLFLLAVGAGISGLLVPYFTQRWQDRKAALDMKKDLVELIATSVTGIAMSIKRSEYQLIDMPKNLPEKEYNEKEKQILDNLQKEQFEWHSECGKIGSRIYTYFHRSIIPRYWENYYKIMDQFYELTEAKIGKRSDILKAIKTYIKNLEEIIGQMKTLDQAEKEKIKNIDPSEININYDILANGPDDQNYKKQYDNLYKRIYELKHELMSYIIETNMAGFSRERLFYINWSFLKKMLKLH